MSSAGSSSADDLDLGGSTVKHVRTYQVYRGMSPEAVSRLEVRDAAVSLSSHPANTRFNNYCLPTGIAMIAQ